MIFLKLVDYNILYQKFTVQFIKLFCPRWSHKFLCAYCLACSKKKQAVFALVRLTKQELIDPSVQPLLNGLGRDHYLSQTRINAGGQNGATVQVISEAITEVRPAALCQIWHLSGNHK